MRLDRGAGNFYIIKVPPKRVAAINLNYDDNLKAALLYFNRWTDNMASFYVGNVLEPSHVHSPVPPKAVHLKSHMLFSVYTCMYNQDFWFHWDIM